MFVMKAKYQEPSKTENYSPLADINNECNTGKWKQVAPVQYNNLVTQVPP